MFTNTKAKLAYDPETGQLGTARTEGTISYLNANELLSSDIGKQLHIATVLSHESARDGRDSPNQQSETRESVRAHWRYQDVLARGRHGRAYVGALDRDKALDFVVGRLYEKEFLGDEAADAYADQFYNSEQDNWSVLFASAGVSGGAAVGGTTETGLVFSYDPETKNFQVGSYETVGGGAYIGVGVAPNVGFTILPNADKIDDVRGLGFNWGVGFGVGPFGGGVDFTMSLSDVKNMGGGGSLSPKIGLTPFSVNVFVTKTFAQLQGEDRDWRSALSQAAGQDPSIAKRQKEYEKKIQEIFSKLITELTYEESNEYK